MGVNVGSMAILELVKPALGDFFRSVVSLISFLDMLPDVGECFTGASRNSDDMEWLLDIGLL